MDSNNKGAIGAKPVLPPISHTPDDLSEVDSDTQDIVKQIRQAMAAVRDAKNLVTNPDKYDSAFVTLVQLQLTRSSLTSRVIFGKVFLDEGLCPLVERYWSMLGLNNPKLWQKFSKQERAITNFNYLLYTLLNMTDTGNIGLLSQISDAMSKFILSVLGSDILHPSTYSRLQGNLAVCFIGLIYNIVQKWEDGSTHVRTLGGVNVLTKYASSTDPAVKTLAIIVLCYLITEDEQKKLLETTNANIKYMVKVLAECVQSQDHKSADYGYSVVEIMDGLNRMAVNDVNKEEIVSSGALPHYVTMLKNAYAADEQTEACKGLWTLAFNDSSRDKIVAYPGCMDELRRLTSSTTESVKKAAEGALWVIEGQAKRVQTISEKAPVAAKKRESHIMLSYNWGVQSEVVKIKDALKAAGYNVWIDVEQMTGSTLEAMSKAIEEAVIVLIFYTEKYKLSSACRLEADYTYKLGKKFIPIRMQANYKPDGWLGLLLGTLLYFDFTKGSQWQETVHGLCTEIKKLLREHDAGGDIPDSTPLASLVASLTQSGSVSKDTQSTLTPCALPLSPQVTSYGQLKSQAWTKAEVNLWMKTCGLDKYSAKFAEFSGSHVVALRRLMDSAPEFFYLTMKQDFGFELVDLLTIANVLQTLE